MLVGKADGTHVGSIAVGSLTVSTSHLTDETGTIV
jgi:hypothetical protein